MHQSIPAASSRSYKIILIGNHVRDKSSGLANAQSPGSAKFANAPTLGLTDWPGGQMPCSSPGGEAGLGLAGGGWAQLESTDA